MVKRLVTLCVVGLIYSASAASPSQNDNEAHDAAVQWLQLIDAGRYEEAASQGSQELHSFEQWLSYLKNQRVSLGHVNKRQFTAVKRTALVSGVPEVRRYFLVRFTAALSGKPSVTEQIALSKIGCCWEIFGYQISDK